MCECCGADCKECGETWNDWYPWICYDCGRKYGTPQNKISTYHGNRCGWCNTFAPVTHYRNYNYPKIPDQDQYIWPKNQLSESEEP